MRPQALVSIIIPLYNRGSLIGETLDSILQQSYQNWECVVVDDGSTDDSIQVVEYYTVIDSRILLLHRIDQPKGANKCRNIGLEKACGDYIIFLDSDDLLDAHCLEKRMALFDVNPTMDFLVFNTLLFQDNTDLYGYNKLWNIDSPEDDLLRFLRIDGVWQTTGPVYRRSFISQFPFDELLPFWQDLEIAIRILLHNPHYKKYLNEAPDVFIRWHINESVSRSELNASIRFKQKLNIMDRILAVFESRGYKYRLAYQKQFVLTYYKVSKEVFYGAHTLKQSLLPVMKLLRIFPCGYPLFIILFFEQFFFFFLTKGRGKVIVKLRIEWLKFMNQFVYRILGISKSTLYQCKYIV